jgi:ATP citrate (pro-S)-lyase
VEEQSEISPNDVSRLFTPDTQAVVFGMQTNAVQRMLDFDHMCGRKEPSVACMVFPFSGNHFQKFYWGTKEILMPVYESASTAFVQHPQVSVVVSFASCRSVFKSTMDILLMAPPNLRVVAMIAEGVPEKRARQLIRKAKEVNVLLIGPATVGGIFPGAFRIGNAGGALDNVIASKLYRRGSVGYVSRSGGLSNELNNMCARYADGVSCGVAIGGDRFCGSTFIDFVLMYQADPHVKIILVLGEVGGVEERLIGEAMVDGRITKPVIAWCTGTCAKIFTHEVQFGHAGALAQSELQTADSKNAFLRECGALVPMSFDQLPDLLAETYQSMVKAGTIRRFAEPAKPIVPMDYKWAAKLGLIRKPTSIVSSITDERGDELMYAGMPISTVFEQDMGIGGVVALLWFRRRLPTYVYKYIEMIIMLVSDHGPAVTSAMATLVTARGGKDLVSSLCAGLLGVGNRFGGAIHDGAKAFYELGQKQGLSPKEFVMHHAKEKKLILGIGHRVKSVENPDKRVELLKAYVAEHFEATPLLDYALEVEKITTQKKSNLILNVDGVIGVTFIDMMQNCGAFTPEEVDEYLDMDCLNALFVTGRTIGLIGHYIDQKRLKQPLYRHDWGDILYATDVKNGM